jgi:hypothetical protein
VTRDELGVANVNPEHLARERLGRRSVGQGAADARRQAHRGFVPDS